MFIIFLLYNYFPFLIEIIMHIDLNWIAEHKLCKPKYKPKQFSLNYISIKEILAMGNALALLDHPENFGWSHSVRGANLIFNNRRYPKFALILFKCPAHCRELHFSGAPEPPSHPSPVNNFGFYAFNHSLPDLICNCIRCTDWLELPALRTIVFIAFTCHFGKPALSSPRLRKHCGKHFVLPDRYVHLNN